MRDITFHYTNEQMVKDLIALTPIELTDSVLDAGSGKNKVWFKNLPQKEKYECEIEDGCDFLKDWAKKVDWVIGNPPFHVGKDFLQKASEIANKGIAFLGNINFFNSLLPSRLEKLKENGFYLQSIHIVQDKRWFGRYYYFIFQKKESKLITWNKETYK